MKNERNAFTVGGRLPLSVPGPPVIDYQHPEMSHPTPADDSATLFVLLPADGSSMGNLALRTRLGWGEERYLAARQPLLDTGIAATGRVIPLDL
jgi:hypothetical protein